MCVCMWVLYLLEKKDQNSRRKNVKYERKDERNFLFFFRLMTGKRLVSTHHVFLWWDSRSDSKSPTIAAKNVTMTTDERKKKKQERTSLSLSLKDNKGNWSLYFTGVGKVREEKKPLSPAQWTQEIALKEVSGRERHFRRKVAKSTNWHERLNDPVKTTGRREMMVPWWWSWRIKIIIITITMLNFNDTIQCCWLSHTSQTHTRTLWRKHISHNKD